MKNLVKNPATLVCFPNSALGLTSFSNQGSGHHGWNPTDSIPPSFGRAPLLWTFRKKMMDNINVLDAKKYSLRDIVIFFSSKSSQRINIDFTKHFHETNKLVPELEKRISSLVGHDRLRVIVKHQVLHEMSAKEQIEETSRVCVFITAAGGGAFTAQFLPKGSSIILYQHSEGEHLHKGNVDWKFFNAATWMRAKFLDFTTTAHDTKSLSKLVQTEALNCVQFMEALDVI